MLLASWLVWLGRHQRDEGWQWGLSTLSPWRGTDCWKSEDGVWGWWCGRLPDFRIGKAGGRHSKIWPWDPSWNVGEAISALTRAKDSRGERLSQGWSLGGKERHCFWRIFVTFLERIIRTESPFWLKHFKVCKVLVHATSLFLNVLLFMCLSHALWLPTHG